MSVATSQSQTVLQLLGGGRRVDRIGDIKRTWSVKWSVLTVDEYSLIAAWAQGALGPGPYVWIDEQQRNMLPPNVAAGGDVRRDITGVNADVGVTLTASTELPAQGLRSFRAAFPAGTSSTATIVRTGSVVYATVDPASRSDSVPVIAGLQYAFGVDVARAAGGNASVQPYIAWYDRSGALLSTDSGVAFATTAAFTRLSVVAVAPATAALARVGVRLTASPVSAAVVYADRWQLEQASAAGAWVPGWGVPRVMITDFPWEHPVDRTYNVSATMIEV